MGSEITYIDCCNMRKKEELKVEKDEKVEIAEVIQTNQIPKSDSPEKTDNLLPQGQPVKENGEIPQKRGYISHQGKPIKETEEISSLNNENLIKLYTLDSDFSQDPNLYTEFKPEHLSSIGDYCIKIYIDYLEITYKLCDEFGSHFKPFIEINYENNKKTIYISDEKISDSNLSDQNDLNNSDLNTSNNIINLSAIHKNQVVNASIAKDKCFSFKNKVIFSGNKYTSYFPIIFRVKNTKVYSHLNSAYPSITIGEAYVPPNIVYSKKKGMFEGFLRIMLRKVEEIGRLKVKIKIGDRNESSPVLETKNEKDNSLNLNNYIDSNMIYNQGEIWDEEITNYYEIEPVLLNRYFLFEILTNKQSYLKLANKLILNNVTDSKILSKIYLKTIKQDNSVSLYQILNQLIKLAIYEEFNPIHEFFKHIGEEKKDLFFKVSISSLCNVYIVERFLMFLYYSQRYYNLNKSPTIRINKFWDDYYLAEMFYKTIKTLYEQYRKHNYDSLYLIQVRECFIWCLNNLNELLTLPKYLNSASEDIRTIEYTSIYKCCITVMSYRICLLKLIDEYSTDSEIMCGLIRVFRKATQILTYDSSTLIDKSLIEGSPNEVSRKFKILLIEKHKGLFILSLKLLLQKYHHYPDLHLNILILIFQLTGFIDSKYKILAYKLLGHKEFTDIFSIYKAKLKKFSKLLNNLHLNCLANFSEITKSEAKYIGTDSEEYQNHLNEVMNDFRSFYKSKKTSKKKKEDFILNKQEEFEIQEIVIRIFANLVKSNFLFKDLINDTYFFIDIVDYLGKFTGQYKRKDNKEYIRYLLEKERRSGEGIRKSILSLVENSVSVIKEFVIRGKENEEIFKNLKSSLSNSYSNSYMISLITSCLKNLKSYQIFSTKLDALVRETKEIIDSCWN